MNDGSTLDLGLIYVKKGRNKDNPVEREFIIFLILIPIFIYALYKNWIAIEAICSGILTINSILLFRYMFCSVKVKECSCTYAADYLAVKVLYTDGVLTYSDIEKAEYNEKSGALYVYCKKEGKPVVIAFSVYKDNDIKSFSNMTGCTVSMV